MLFLCVCFVEDVDFPIVCAINHMCFCLHYHLNTAISVLGHHPPSSPPNNSEYADFRVSSDGEVQGVGLLIASDPDSGKLLVLAPIRGGPADRAGLKPGDLVCVGCLFVCVRESVSVL